jgi:diadenosine tetraphosphate (Ap4A) HIT family hydrolase
LGLLPSGPDPVGEWLVHHQPPGSHIGNIETKSKPRLQKTAIVVQTKEKSLIREIRLPAFDIDERLERDGLLIVTLGLCQLRVNNDRRWPWLVLIPQRADVSEIFDLTPLDQTMLTFETNMVASALKKVTGATKINVGALGNIVRQLHVHVIARSEGDANWPGPVWGFGTAEPWGDDERKAFAARILENL